mmetsp:Transcript_11386/g.32797  ORF Transcript_11386/g.32797 Transcript_11386/m.32797 type:complete len:319 (-) Transcript_11386:456-1412(-)
MRLLLSGAPGHSQGRIPGTGCGHVRTPGVQPRRRGALRNHPGVDAQKELEGCRRADATDPGLRVGREEQRPQQRQTKAGGEDRHGRQCPRNGRVSLGNTKPSTTSTSTSKPSTTSKPKPIDILPGLRHGRNRCGGRSGRPRQARSRQDAPRGRPRSHPAAGGRHLPGILLGGRQQEPLQGSAHRREHGLVRGAHRAPRATPGNHRQQRPRPGLSRRAGGRRPRGVAPRCQRPGQSVRDARAGGLGGTHRSGRWRLEAPRAGRKGPGPDQGPPERVPGRPLRRLSRNMDHPQQPRFRRWAGGSHRTGGAGHCREPEQQQ